MRATVPMVYLIARPQLDNAQIRKYLESVGGAAWLDRVEQAKVTPAEMLAEFAGRMCYRAWAPGLNKNVTKVREDSAAYLANVVHSGHGSIFEHANFTFIFQDISRVFSHELVRHRAGVAVSQESLRYVRLHDLGFRIPEVLKDPEDYPECGVEDTSLVQDADGPYGEDGEPHQGDGERFRSPRCNLKAGHEGRWHTEHDADGRVYAQYSGPPSAVPEGTRPAMEEQIVHIVEELEEFQRQAAEAFGLDDEGVPFHVKKEVTSALRRLAPLGLSTTMVWTANLRTLRHVIEMRTEEAAEEEIRLVFDQVALMMKTECPALFADFERQSNGVWTSAHRKV